MALKKAASQKVASKKGVCNKAASKKAASKRVPAQSVRTFFERLNGIHAAAAVVDPNIRALAVIPKQERQVEQKFDDSADIPAAQPDVQE